MNSLSPELFKWLSLCLCPPGDGVYKINTAKDRKTQLQRELFGDIDNIKNAWKQSLKRLAKAPKVNILGIPSDCGGGILRGANWGPLFLRSVLLNNKAYKTAFDLGDVRVIPHLLSDKYLNQNTIEQCRLALYHGSTIDLPVSPLSITEEILLKFYAAFPENKIFAIGGDHSISYPLVKAYLTTRKPNARCAVIHFDAHTDLLTTRLGIDLCFGSWAAHILKYLKSPQHLVQIGIRSSAKPKAYWQSKFAVKQFWSDEIIDTGISNTVMAICKHLKQEHINEVYISFDIDVLDEKLVSCTGTPEPNGLPASSVVEIIKLLSKEFLVTGADIMELAPLTDPLGIGLSGQQETLKTTAMISTLLLNCLHQHKLINSAD